MQQADRTTAVEVQPYKVHCPTRKAMVQSYNMHDNYLGEVQEVVIEAAINSSPDQYADDAVKSIGEGAIARSHVSNVV